MVGVNCFTTRTKKYKKNPFFKNKFNSKKAIFLLFVDHGKKNGTGKKKVATDVNYIPRTVNSEKRYKKENVTISVLNKKGLPGTSAKTIWAKRSGGTLERLTRWRRSDVLDVPLHIYMSSPRK